MKIFLTSCMAVCWSFVFSQTVLNVDKTEGLPLNAYYTVSGTPFVNYRFVRLVEGTPYFRDTWMSGIVVADDEKAYKNNRVKLDLVDHRVHFMNEKNEEYVCTLPLIKVSLTDSVSKTTYRFIHSSLIPALFDEKKGWYQVLVDGKVSLFQTFVKSVQEDKPYNSGVAEQRIYTREEFLMIYNGRVLKAKKPKDLPALLTDGKGELENYLKQGLLKQGSTAEQMTALVTYFNSLE